MKTIYSITEAFSMQPETYHLDKIMYQGSRRTAIHRIVEESIQVNDRMLTFYVGYDENKQRLFEYQKGTVNIHYQFPY